MGEDWTWRAVQRLAAAVVIQAIADARRGDVEAVRWLDCGPGRAWCQDFELGAWRWLIRWRWWVGALRIDDAQHGRALARERGRRWRRKQHEHTT